MIRKFETQADFEAFTPIQYKSGDIYYIVQDDTFYIWTNNIDGELKLWGGSGGSSGFPKELIDRTVTTFNIPEGCQKIGAGAFYLSDLVNVTIPESVTNIGNHSFKKCKLETIEIPSGVTTIGGSAFFDCTSLSSVTVKATTPPTISADTFPTAQDINFYVPAESVEAYKTATNWSAYAEKIFPII